MIKKKYYTARGLDTSEKVRVGLMLRLKTLRDRSPSHIAGMLIIGNTMGINDAVRSIKEHAGADDGVTQLALRLQNVEETNTANLRRFL